MQDLFRKVLEESRVPNYYPTYSESINEPKAAELSYTLAKKIAVDFAAWLGVDDGKIEDRYDKFINEYTNDN